MHNIKNDENGIYIRFTHLEHSGDKSAQHHEDRRSYISRRRSAFAHRSPQSHYSTPHFRKLYRTPEVSMGVLLGVPRLVRRVDLAPLLSTASFSTKLRHICSDNMPSSKGAQTTVRLARHDQAPGYARDCLRELQQSHISSDQSSPILPGKFSSPGSYVLVCSTPDDMCLAILTSQIVLLR